MDLSIGAMELEPLQLTPYTGAPSGPLPGGYVPV